VLEDTPPSFFSCRFIGQAPQVLVRKDLAVSKQKKPDESLKGWAAIAKFLGQPVPTVQRWATEGMPVTRVGRYVAASPAELEGWLTLEAGAKETVHIPSANADLLADLKRGLLEARKAHRKSPRS
jgi:hypothetical protein